VVIAVYARGSGCAALGVLAAGWCLSNSTAKWSRWYSEVVRGSGAARQGLLACECCRVHVAAVPLLVYELFVLSFTYDQVARREMVVACCACSSWGNGRSVMASLCMSAT
jgi:hypothetical protein